MDVKVLDLTELNYAYSKEKIQSETEKRILGWTVQGWAISVFILSVCRISYLLVTGN